MSHRELDLERALADLAAALEFPPTPDLAAAVDRPARRGPGGGARTAQPGGPPPVAGGLPAGGGWPRPGWPCSCWPRPCWSPRPGPARRWPRRPGRVASASDRRPAHRPTGTTTPGGRRRPGARGAGHPGRGPPPSLLPGPGPGRPRVRPARRRVRQRGRPRRRPGRPRLPGPAGPARLLLHRRRPADHRVPGPAGPRVPQEGHRRRHGPVRHGGGEPGYCFSGEPHFFSYRDAAGTLREEQTRLAGNTLIWYEAISPSRLEGELPMEEAIRIAESMR